jgi:hypothetical protein
MKTPRDFADDESSPLKLNKSDNDLDDKFE